jgi:D-amino-acid dehydrogenase
MFMLCKTEHALEEEAKTAEFARQLGVPAQVLGPKETASAEPGVRMDVAGSVFFPKDCHLTPGRFMAALRQEAERVGAKFSWSTEVSGIRHSGSHAVGSSASPGDSSHVDSVGGKRITSVMTSRGEFEADEFVVCGGSWSPLLLRSLGLRLPMQAGKGYSLTLPHPPRLPQTCAIFTEARVAVTPMGSSLRFGGTMEIAGLNEEINPVRVQGIINAVPRYYPEFAPRHFEGVQPWRGLRPCSPDGLPYVGRTRRFANLSIASGHAMMGLTLGPITGKLMAEVLSGEKPSIAIERLDPDRFVGRGKRI